MMLYILSPGNGELWGKYVGLTSVWILPRGKLNVKQASHLYVI